MVEFIMPPASTIDKTCSLYSIVKGRCNLPPVFTEDMNNLALSEATPVGWIVYTLEGYDPEGSEVTFGLVGTDHFMVHPTTGKVEVTKALDREVRDHKTYQLNVYC